MRTVAARIHARAHLSLLVAVARVVLVALVLLVTLDAAAAVVIDSYTTGTYGGSWYTASAAARYYDATEFCVGAGTGYTLDAVSMIFGDYEGGGNCPNHVNISIWTSGGSDPGNYPGTYINTLNVLNSGTANFLDFSECDDAMWDSTPGCVHNITPQYGAIELSADTCYYIVTNQVETTQCIIHQGGDSGKGDATSDQRQSASSPISWAEGALDFGFIAYGTPAAGGGAPMVTLLSPPGGDHLNDDPVVFTANVTSESLANCTLLVDGSPAEGVVTGVANTTIGWNATLSEGSYTWSVQCTNTAGQTNSTARNVTVDRTRPDWTLNPGNVFAADNTTVWNLLQQGSTLLLNVTADDTYLFGVNVSIYEGALDGTMRYSNQTINLSVSTHTITAGIDVSAWPSATYIVRLYAEDDHTALVIPEYDYALLRDRITYTTPTASITIRDLTDTTTRISTTKETDRYTFDFAKETASTTLSYRLVSTEPLYYRGGLYPFPSFVTGKQWVDFDTGVKGAAYKVTIRDAYSADILITLPAALEEVKFRSLGGLNTQEETYSFALVRVPNQTTNLTATVIDNEWVFLEWTPGTGASGTNLTRDGVVVYAGNGTSFNDTNLTGGVIYDYAALAYYNFSGVLSYNVSVTTGVNRQLVQTLFNGSAIFYLYDERTYTLLTTNITVSYLSLGNNVTRTTSNGVISFTNLTEGNYTLRFSGENYGFRELYVVFNATGSMGIGGIGGIGIEEIEWVSDHQNVSLFLLHDDDRAYTLVTVIDQRTNPLSGAIVKLLRYYHHCNCYLTIQMATTKNDGTALFNTQHYTAFYKWIVEDDGATQYISSTPETLYPDASGLAKRTITIDKKNNFYTSFIGLTSVDYTLTWINTTTTLALMYNDPNTMVTQGCLEAWTLAGMTRTTIGPNCTNGAAGGINLYLPHANNQTYHWNAYVHTDTTYSTLLLANGVIGTTAPTFPFGNLGIFLFAGLIVIGATLLSFSGIAVLLWVSLMMGAGMLLNFAGFIVIPLNYHFLIGMASLTIGAGIYLLRR